MNLSISIRIDDQTENKTKYKNIKILAKFTFF